MVPEEHIRELMSNPELLEDTQDESVKMIE